MPAKKLFPRRFAIPFGRGFNAMTLQGVAIVVRATVCLNGAPILAASRLNLLCSLKTSSRAARHKRPKVRNGQAKTSERSEDMEGGAHSQTGDAEEAATGEAVSRPTKFGTVFELDLFRA